MALGRITEITDSLGSLERVEISEVWKNETSEFTPWLVENIHLLSEALEMNLEVVRREQNVGPYRADIHCIDMKAEESTETVLIENQLDTTDHKHLGQLLTYASGLEARTIVWIARQFSEEYRSAIDWLNEISREEIRFFGCEIELWKIGDSQCAPQFKVVCKPNEWSKSFRQQQENSNQSETQIVQLKFWMAFIAFLQESQSKLRCQRPRGDSKIDLPVGKSGIFLRASISTWNLVEKSSEAAIRAEVLLSGAEANERYKNLFDQKSEIEEEFKNTLIWYAPENIVQRRILVSKIGDFRNETEWRSQHAWLRDNLENLQKVLLPRL